jgi:PAS domain S-box-containing protein
MPRRRLSESVRLHEVLDAIPHKIWIVRPDGLASYYNQAIRDYVGAPIAPDREGRDRQIVHPQDHRALAHVRGTAMVEARDFSVDIRLRRYDGAWRWHRLEVFLLRDADHVEAWVVTATDLDDLMRALVEAEQAGNYLRLAAQAAQLGVYRFDLETSEHDWSPELCSIFGLPSESPAPKELLPLIHPDDRERVAALMRASRDPSGDGVFEDEHRIIRADGKVRWVLVKGRVAFAGDQENRTAQSGVGVVLDITDRKSWEQALAQSEERYRTLVENASDIIAMIDLEGRVTAVNSVVGRTLGYSVEEMIDRPIDEFLATDRAVLLETLRQRNHESAPLAQRELEARARNGERRIVLDAKLKLMTNSVGEPAAVHLIARDITERREAEARQALLIRELQHRTRNMLAVIQSIARATLGRSPNLESVFDTFIGRLHALANAQDFIAAGSGGGVPLRQLLDAELSSFGTRVAIEGEPIVLSGSPAQTFALLVHELTTNARKHGALSDSNGRLTIRWAITTCAGPDPQLQFSWIERSGPPASAPVRKGFGTELLSALGKSELKFNRSGFEYALTLPLSEIMLIGQAPADL